MWCGSLYEIKDECMRIVFLTMEDPLYILPFFDEFFHQELGDVEVQGIFSCKTMGDRGQMRLLREMVCLYGVAGLARLGFRSINSRALSLMPANKGSNRFYSVAQICRAFGIHHESIGNPNREEYVSRIASLGPDLLVSVACPYILKARMPTFWQMYHGEKNVGVTIHYMAARVDEGEALLQDQVAIRYGESLDSLIQRTKRH